MEWYSQSSQEHFLIMVSFVHTLMEKQKRARARKDEPTPRTAGTRVGGSTKLACTPRGGVPAGKVRSTLGGSCLISWMSILAELTVSYKLEKENEKVVRWRGSNLLNI